MQLIDNVAKYRITPKIQFLSISIDNVAKYRITPKIQFLSSFVTCTIINSFILIRKAFPLLRNILFGIMLAIQFQNFQLLVAIEYEK